MKLTVSYLQKTLGNRFEYALLQELTEVSQYKSATVGSYLIRPGEFIRTVPIIIQGSVKIIRQDQDGREALLYYLGGLDACAMSLTCCLGSKQSQITALIEENTDYIAIPVAKVDEWMCRYSSWKQFVFQTYQKRFDNLLSAIDDIIFHRLDERLLSYLQRKVASSQCSILKVTHEEIAQDLATSREVISRLLKQLERNGRIQLMRNKITMLD